MESKEIEETQTEEVQAEVVVVEEPEAEKDQVDGDKPEATQDEKDDFSVSKLKDMLAILIGLSSVFVALVWIYGRIYAQGYFSAMNIPPYFVNFSTWEYGEQSWDLLIILFSASAISISFGWILGKLLAIFISAVWEKISRRIGKFIGTVRGEISKKKTTKNQELSLGDYSLLTQLAIKGLIYPLIGIPLFTVMITIFSLRIHDAGYNAGQRTTLLSGYTIDIMTDVPLDISGAIPNQVNQSELWVYTDLRLLAMNSGRVYAFQEIDPTTCHPVETFSIDTKHVIQIDLKPPESIVGECSNPAVLERLQK